MAETLREQAKKKLGKGASQKQMAQEIGFSQAMVSLWLNHLTDSKNVTNAVEKWVQDETPIELSTEDLQLLVKQYALASLDDTKYWELPLGETKALLSDDFSQSKVGMGIVATSGSDDSEWETLTISSDIHTSSLPTTINVLGDNGEIREVTLSS
eukprot:TRINITY_DN14833_c0_g1_i1.p1 TRINITY_DN14833_c0_g1~~TRINITY_DN14833_c0_g1_i1.p1  ORF type:complete len:179 (-),score=39.85 TRINITY_DN14833_c0_g1_i1:35-499(-)